MLSALSAAGADCLVIGAHAMAAHDQARATQDIDIWVRPTPENARRVWAALADFGAPLHQLTLDDLSQPGVTFQIGLPPLRIDILTQISGVTFDEAWPNRIVVNDGPLTYSVIGKADLIRNKRAAARPKDLIDADNLENDPQ
jgi:hypothetical protein